jgi:hypothetical protein
MPAASARFENRFEEALRPALELLRQGRFVERWEQENPWTAANIPGLREVIAEMAREMASGGP